KGGGVFRPAETAKWRLGFEPCPDLAVGPKAGNHRRFSRPRHDRIHSDVVASVVNCHDSSQGNHSALAGAIGGISWGASDEPSRRGNMNDGAAAPAQHLRNSPFRA